MNLTLHMNISYREESCPEPTSMSRRCHLEATHQSVRMAAATPRTETLLSTIASQAPAPTASPATRAHQQLPDHRQV